MASADEKIQSYTLLAEGGKSTGKHVRITGARARFSKNEDFCFSTEFHVCGSLEHVRSYVTDNTKGKKQQNESMSRVYTRENTSEGGSLHTQFEAEVSSVRDVTRIHVPSVPRGFDFSALSASILQTQQSNFSDPTKRRVRASSPRPVDV